MGAKNKVIAGEWKGDYVVGGWKSDLCISSSSIGLTPHKFLNTKEIEAYELVTEDKVRSGSSAILRGAAGAALLGPVGMLAGLTGKKKGVFTIAIKFKSGEKIIIEVDDKLYNQFVSEMW